MSGKIKKSNLDADVTAMSGLGGMYTFGIRFLQARKEIIELDKTHPLEQPDSDESE